MPVDLVIFDCDGVLVDSETITASTWIEAATDLGVEWDLDEHVERFRGSKGGDVLAALEAEIARPVPEGFMERFRERLYERLSSEVEAVSGVEEALDRIPLPVCVASNGPRPKMEATLGSTDLLRRFEGRLFTGYEVGSFKPEPGLFLAAARELGAEPHRCVVVEDSDTGREAAVAAGMQLLLYAAEDGIRSFEGGRRFTDMARLPELIANL